MSALVQDLAREPCMIAKGQRMLPFSHLFPKNPSRHRHMFLDIHVPLCSHIGSHISAMKIQVYL